jgi:ABC-type multidrug transport system fused ATPase/permease subunit
VSQHPALFDMTIAENIAYGRDDASINSRGRIKARAICNRCACPPEIKAALSPSLVS